MLTLMHAYFRDEGANSGMQLLPLWMDLHKFKLSEMMRVDHV